LVAGLVKWAERWIARAQRKADLRAERFLRHEAGMRAGTEPPGLLDRLQSWITFRTERFVETRGRLSVAWANERRIDGNWLLAAGLAGVSLADAWRTWVAGGPVCGPDGVTVTIWVQYAGQDLPFGDRSGDLAPLTWQDLVEVRKVYSVCVRRMPAGAAWVFCSFATETSARWCAVELARTVRQGGISGLRRADIVPERRRPARSDRVLAQELIGVRSRPGHGSLRVSRRARAQRRQL
jgi:hypothetical protein